MNDNSTPRKYLRRLLWAALLTGVAGGIYVFMDERTEARRFECMQQCGSQGLKYEYIPPSGYRATSADRCECQK
jgi:hypothetical protein